jgi:hypothetical protein
MVWLYRLPILDEWAATGDITLEELVGHVVIHELGHHFGWSDEEMDVLQEGECQAALACSALNFQASTNAASPPARKPNSPVLDAL